MTASAKTQQVASFEPSSASSLPESFVAIASPEVRVLAAEWIESSRAYFRALDRWNRISNAPPDRDQVEMECDLAFMEDEAVRHRIIDLRPTEAGALALKAAAFLAHMPDPEDVDVAIADLVGDEGPIAEAFALTLARGMVDVLGLPVRELADAAKPDRAS